MNILWNKYRKVLEQCFIPIFVKDEFRTETLLRGCELAGISTIEYTLRREDAHQIIPILKKRYPGKIIFAGSTIDDETIVNQMKRRYPQLMTLSQLAPYVDGFVSMLNFSEETLRYYHSTHLLIPSAETRGEAFLQMKNGATFIKIGGPDLTNAKRMHSAPTFDFCPTFFTGGVKYECMEEIFSAGNMLVAAGFDLLLKGEDPEGLTSEHVAERISLYVNAAQTARKKAISAFERLEIMTDKDVIESLPNYCSVLE